MRAVPDLDILDGYNLLADNVIYHLWHHIVTSESPLEVEDERAIPLKRIDTHMYARMSIPANTLYTTLQLEKLHRQFSIIRPLNYTRC